MFNEEIIVWDQKDHFSHIDISILWNKENNNAYKKLEEMGRNGWELVSMIPVSRLRGETLSVTSSVLFTLKRQIE